MNSWEFIAYGEEMSVILRHIIEQFGQGPSKAKLQNEFFLMEQRKTEHQSICWKGGTVI